MRLPFAARDVPGRLSMGAYILHSGLEKWNGSPERAAAVHGMAAGAFPFLRAMPPETFLRLLSIGEITIGTALLAPIIPSKVAGTLLTAFSGSLLTMYWRTPTLHKPGSVWPTPAGIAVSKDVWMFGIGLGMLIDDGAPESQH